MSKSRLLALAAFLTLWYGFSSPNYNQLAENKDYTLPKEIEVLDTSFRFHYRKKKEENNKLSNLSPEKKNQDLRKIVETDDIDFSEDFYIKTGRYTLIKDDDWLPSRMIGHVLSLPQKLFFWDWNASWGMDEKRARSVLSMLENDEVIKDITVRVNHNEAFYDWYRMMFHENLRERNPFIFRASVGSLTTIKHELLSELGRGDYYNPLTRTAVVYSNIESIAAHEIGHHKDFSRFDTDWFYSLGRLMPPVMLYQELRASLNAKKTLDSKDNWQFNRYLIPAFLTYLMATYFISKKILQKADHKVNGNGKDFDKLKEYEKPEVHPLQTLRHFATWNACFYSSIAAYQVFSPSNSDFLKGAAFCSALVGTKYLLNLGMKHIIPYNHEIEG